MKPNETIVTPETKESTVSNAHNETGRLRGIVRKALIGLMTAAEVLSVGCAATPSSDKQTVITHDARQKRTRTKMKYIEYCSSSRRDIRQTINDRCLQNIKTFRRDGMRCVSCDVEEEYLD